MAILKTEIYKNRTLSLPGVGIKKINEEGLFSVETLEQAKNLEAIISCDFKIVDAEIQYVEDIDLEDLAKANHDDIEDAYDDSDESTEDEAKAESESDDENAEQEEKVETEAKEEQSTINIDEYRAELKKLKVAELKELVTKYPKKEVEKLSVKNDFIDYIISKISQ